MRKAVLIGGLVGIILLAGLGWTFLPQFFDKSVNESADQLKGERLPQPKPADTSVELDTPAEVQPQSDVQSEPSGTFTGVGGHSASGKVTLIRTTKANYLRFESDFNVTNGPDLFVYVGDTSKPQTQIAKLKGNKGSQNYELPTGVSPTSFSTVWIYCRAFSVDFAKASLAR